MDWFERLTGFRESGYEHTRTHLHVEGDRLHSRVNGCSYGIGELEVVSLGTLRERHAPLAGEAPGKLRVSILSGNVRPMHQWADHHRALFQVASQFNLLEMVSPAVTPEDGVTRYAHDPTQGPACAIAAGAATLCGTHPACSMPGCPMKIIAGLVGLLLIAVVLGLALPSLVPGCECGLDSGCQGCGGALGNALGSLSLTSFALGAIGFVLLLWFGIPLLFLIGIGSWIYSLFRKRAEAVETRPGE